MDRAVRRSWFAQHEGEERVEEYRNGGGILTQLKDMKNGWLLEKWSSARLKALKSARKRAREI